MASKKFPRQPYERVKFPLPPGFQASIVVELRYEAPVAPAQDKFVGVDGGEAIAQRLNEVLDQPEVAKILPSFALKPRMIAASMNVSAALSVAPPAAAVSTRIEAQKGCTRARGFFQEQLRSCHLEEGGRRQGSRPATEAVRLSVGCVRSPDSRAADLLSPARRGRRRRAVQHRADARLLV